MSVKHVTLLALFLMLFPAAAFCAATNLSWDPATDRELAAYRVTYQSRSSSAAFSDTGSAAGSPASHYFAVTAYNTINLDDAYVNVAAAQDMVPPVVGITAPGAHAAVNGATVVTISADDNVGVSRVELYVNGALQAAGNASPYVFEWNTASLTAGQYTLVAKAYDAAGNVGKAEEVVSVVGDTLVPAVSISAPAANAHIQGKVNVAALAEGKAGIATLALYDNATLLFTGNEPSLSYNWNTATVANGNHTLVVVATDTSGNASSASVAVSVANDTAVPSVTLTSPTSSLLKDAKLVIAADAVDDVAVTRMEVYVDGSKVAMGNSGSISASAKVSPGTHTVTVNAYDTAGRKGSTSLTVRR